MSSQSPSQSSEAGKLHMAAALAFHIPGARLDLSGADGTECSVGPLTDPRCVLHPAEFRELVVTTGGVMDSLSMSQGAFSWAAPDIQLTMVMKGVHHVGGGLYRITGDEATSYAFVTPLPADVVDATLSGMRAEHYLEYESRQSASSCLPVGGSADDDGADEDIGDVIAVNLIHDEGLGVTMVVMCSGDMKGAICEEVARKAASACLVAEMEHSIHGSEED